MKTLFALAAAAVTTVALSVPASATTVGCDPAEPYTTVKAIDCRLWNNDYAMETFVAPGRHAAFAAAPHARAQIRNVPSAPVNQDAYPADKD